MRELILKEFFLHRRFILINGIFYTLYLAVFASRMKNPKALFIFGAVLYVLVPLMVYSREDRFKATGFRLSLPVTRREFILSRYLLSWLIMILMYASVSGLAILVPGSQLNASAVFQPRAILASLAYMTVFFGPLMPFLTWFGMIALFVFLITMQVLGILLMSLRFLLFKDIKVAIDWIAHTLAAVQGAVGPAGSLALTIGLILLFNYISFEVCVFLFKRKEF